MKVILALGGFCMLSLAALAGVEPAVEALMPRLAATNVAERYAPQMELQAMVAKANRPGAEAERAELAGVLAAKAADNSLPHPARVWVVRQLEYIGGSESVKVLSGLLNSPNAELRECARRALEKNSASAATHALRTALEHASESSWKIGLINSLGQRHDTKSVHLLAQSLSHPELAVAASSALGKVANDAAVQALWGAFEQKVAPAADALVAAADRLAPAHARQAAAIYSRLLTDCSAPQLRAAALVGLAKTDAAQAQQPLAEAFSSPEIQLQSAALTAAGEVYGENVSAEMVKLLPQLNASGKILALRLVDSSAEPTVLTLATDSDGTVRLAALETLGRIGGAAAVPVLVKTAASNSSAEQQTARAALLRVAGSGADDAVAQMAAQGEPKVRAVAIAALGERCQTAGLPALMQYAGESDRTISAPACAALGRLGTANELDGLLRLVLAGKTPAAEEALQAVASRTPDKSAVAQKVIAMSQQADPLQAAPLFDILTLLGGNDALAAVTKGAASENAETKDAAIRALANWPEFAATKPLLAIAADPNAKRVYNVLAIEAVARLVKSADKEPAGARFEAAQSALRAAQRDEEKKLLLSALATVPDPKAGAVIKPFLTEPKFKDEAGLAGMNLAQALLKVNKPAAKDLAQAIKQAAISPELTRKAEAVLRR